MRTTFATVLVVLALVAPSAASGQFLARFTNPQIEVTMTHPPRLPVEFERAAVLPRGRDCAEEFGDSVIESFVSNGVELVDRQHIEGILEEQDFGSSGYVDSATAAELGRILGPSVLVLVNVQRCALEQERLIDRGRNFKGEMITRYIAQTEGHFKASVRVVDLATARIFTAKTVTAQMKLENDDYDGYPEFPSEYKVQDLMLLNARSDVRKMFFPWNERRKLYFFNDDECNLRMAYKLLEIDDTEGALEESKLNVELCETADVKPKFKARAYYNLGMAHFIRGEHERALEHLETAYRMDGGDIIRDSVLECKRAQRYAAEMAEVEESASLEIDSLVASADGGGGVERVRAGGAAPGATGGKAGADGSIGARLEQLDSLKDQGLITQEEYDTKRQEILSEI